MGTKVCVIGELEAVNDEKQLAVGRHDHKTLYIIIDFGEAFV